MLVSCSLSRKLMIAVLLAVALSCPAAAEQPPRIKVVEVIGSGNIHGQDAATARDLAISYGLVLAVHGVVADLISLDTQVQNFQTLNESFYNHTDQFVGNYKVLAESVSGNTYRVMIQATVLVDTIFQRLSDICVTQTQKSLPSILFLIAEQNLEDAKPKYEWGQGLNRSSIFSKKAMTEEMKEKGFSIIDYEAMMQDRNEDFSIYRQDMEDSEAVNLGARLKADVVIVGKSVAQKPPNIMEESTGSFQGHLTARALSTETGAEIASTVQTFTVMNRDDLIGSKEALTGAGILAGKELSSQIASVWLEKDNTLQKLKIFVEGTRHLGNFVSFKRILNGFPGVKQMKTSEVKANEATLIVVFNGNAEKLAETLMSQSFDSFEIKLHETSEDSVRLELLSR